MALGPTDARHGVSTPVTQDVRLNWEFDVAEVVLGKVGSEPRAPPGASPDWRELSDELLCSARERVQPIKLHTGA